jgi:HSP20 family molecular chaperone IbpA
MWNEALSMLEQAERLQRQFARFGGSNGIDGVARGNSVAVPDNGPTWEPPVDIVETADALSVQVALPGAAPESVNVLLDDGSITVTASRGFPAGDRRARVHRLEIPFGRFARRIVLPAGIAARALELAGRSFADGCLILTFRKLEAA